MLTSRSDSSADFTTALVASDAAKISMTLFRPLSPNAASAHIPDTAFEKNKECSKFWSVFQAVLKFKYINQMEMRK